MMNKYWTIIALLLLASGCSQQEPIAETDPTAFAIDVQVEHVQSRAVVAGTSMPLGSSIAVVVKNSNKAETNYGTNGTLRVFTLNNGTWGINTPFSLTEQQGTVTAYYPSNLSSSVINSNYTTLTPEYKTALNCGTVSNGNLTLDGKQIYVHPDEVDYLVGSGSNVSSSVIRSRITLRHAMSMVAVRLIKGATYGNSALLTQLKVENKASSGSLCAGTITIPANEFTPNSTAVTYTRTCSYTAQTIDSGVYIGFLAYPAVLWDNALCTLTLTVDGEAKALDLPGNLSGSYDWKAGNCILYDVTINGKKVEITGVSVAQWVVGEGNGGNMEVQ